MRIWRTVLVVIGGVICATGQFVYDIFIDGVASLPEVSLPSVDVFVSWPLGVLAVLLTAFAFLGYELRHARVDPEKGEDSSPYWQMINRRINRF